MDEALRTDESCRLRLEGYLVSATFIQITRDDLLGQAVSLVVANQTGRWIHEHEPSKEPEYSFGAIATAINQLVAERGNWDRFFALTGITPLRVSYEELTDDRDTAMARVCTHLRLEWQPTDAVEMRVQRTSLSDEWRERFLAALPELHERDGFWRGEFGGLNDDVPRNAVGGSSG